MELEDEAVEFVVVLELVLLDIVVLETIEVVFVDVTRTVELADEDVWSVEVVDCAVVVDVFEDDALDVVEYDIFAKVVEIVVAMLVVTFTTGPFVEFELAAVVSDTVTGIEVLENVARNEVVVDPTDSEANEVEDAVVVEELDADWAYRGN